jgi:hypothetical protein
MEAVMNSVFCLTLAVLLVLAFTAVNLFLPYALVVAGIFIGLGFTCGMIKRRTRSAECPLGFC